MMIPAPVPPAQPPLIAIVDDAPCVREALVSLFRSVGWRAAEYASAEAFLADPEDCAACVVLDLHLPGISGIDAQRLLAARGSRLPVIFVSGDAGARHQQEALGKGAVAFLHKPFSDESMLAAVERAMRPGAEV